MRSEDERAKLESSLDIARTSLSALETREFLSSRYCVEGPPDKVEELRGITTVAESFSTDLVKSLRHKRVRKR